MSEQREMTLDEWMARLPESHAANRELAALRARLAELEAERDRLRGLIDEHNNECVRRCGEGEQEGVRCGYRPYFPRRCPECPRHEMIEVAALEGE